jgi:hypothetical protein
MALSDTTKINISIKKLSGKAQTSNDKGLANEGLPTGLTLSSETIFGDVIPTSPSKTSLYTTTDGTVEYLRFPTTFIAGSDTSSGRHGFELKLPPDYESNSSNSKAGTYPFQNNQVINITSGSLQLVPTSFSVAYEAKPYYGGTSAKGSGTQIPVLDARDWYMDYFNGIFFQQDPSGTGDQADNPDYVEGFLYIGASVKDKIAGGGSGGDPNAEYLVLSATGSLSDERVFTSGIGLASVDAGAGNAYTLNILDSVVATLTGSQFSGNVGVTGSFGATSNSIFGNNSSLSGVDNNFFVYGSIGSKGTATRGTAVFGGDVVISGTLHGGSPLKVAGGLAVTGSLDINPELGDVARIQNLKGKVKVFASSSLELGSYTGIIDLFDLLDGACGQLKMSGSTELTKRTITLSSPGTLFFTGSDGGSSFKGPIHASDGLSGSLTRLQNGSSYLIGGTGINISSASNGSITIGFKNQERVKSIRIINSPIGAGQDCDISANFSNVNYDFNKVDVFVNGQLLVSGSLRDYLLNTAKTGSIHFNFDLLTDDAITTVVSI